MPRTVTSRSRYSQSSLSPILHFGGGYGPQRSLNRSESIMAVLPDWRMGDHDSGRIPASGMADNGVVPWRFFELGERAGEAIVRSWFPVMARGSN
jgi:hypothetical protein